jgi:hypothetical protein
MIVVEARLPGRQLEAQVLFRLMFWPDMGMRLGTNHPCLDLTHSATSSPQLSAFSFSQPWLGDLTVIISSTRYFALEKSSSSTYIFLGSSD